MTDFAWAAESAPLPGFVIRATVVLAMGIAIAWLVRKRSALIRHRLWTATLILLLLLPALAFWAPPWEMPLLPVVASPGAEAEALWVSGPSQAEFAAAPARDGGARPASGPDEGPAAEANVKPAGARDADSAGAGGTESAGALDAAFERGPGPATLHASEPAALRDGGPIAASGPRAQLLLFWAIGCLGGLASLAAGHLRFHTLIRRARPLDDPLWIRDMCAVGSRLGLRRDVRLVVSEAAGTPMTGGFRKPVILLPASSAAWGPERRTVVLMHELVHVRRRDALRQLLSGVVLALYWFHPLSWVAFRMAAASREEACDERVLELGSRPSEYARHLMSLAAGTISARLPVAALSMARQSPSRLERRIMAILRPRHARPSALATAALVAANAALGVAVAVTHPVHRGSAGALFILADPPVTLQDPPAGLQEPPAVRTGDEDARGAKVPQAGSPSENPGFGSSMSHPGHPASGSGEGSVEAGAAASDGEPATGDRTPVVTEPGADAEPFARAPASVGRNAPPRTVVPDVECDSLPPGGGSVFEGGASGSGPDSPPHDVVRVMMETVDGVRLCMRIRTDAVLEAGELRSLAPDDWILLESQGDKLHRLIIRTGSGGFEYEWSVGGEDRPFDEQAKEWRDGMLAVLGGQLEIGRIQREVSDLQEQITHHRGVVSGLQGQVAHDRDVVASLQGQVSYYQGVVSGLLDQVSYHQSVVAGMRDDITYHRSVVSGMRDEISMHRARVAALQDVKSSYQAQITAIIPRLKTADADTRQTIEASISGWEERIKEIEEQIGAYGLGGKVAKINSEIRNYSLDAKVRNLEQQISSYGLNVGWQKIEADIEDQSGRLDDATRRAEEALKAREARIGEVEREVDAYYLDGKVARLEQQIRDLGADEAVARIEQSIEEARRKLIELIRRL